jgi:hypothetical protein
MWKYSKLIIGLLLFMCIARGGLGAFSYIAPEAAFSAFSLPHDPNSPIVYFVRLWAGRDVMIALLILFTPRAHLRAMLYFCIGVELFDFTGAYLGFKAGFFTFQNFIDQVLTVCLAFIPETIALALMVRQDKRDAQLQSVSHQIG